jgi:hypothetical protein
MKTLSRLLLIFSAAGLIIGCGHKAPKIVSLNDIRNQEVYIETNFGKSQDSRYYNGTSYVIKGKNVILERYMSFASYQSMHDIAGVINDQKNGDIKGAIIHTFRATDLSEKEKEELIQNINLKYLAFKCDSLKEQSSYQDSIERP